MEIKVPQMGESIAEAEIGAFIKQDGEYVEENEEIVELETEKVNQPLYAPCSGVISWSVDQGQTVQIGASIGTIVEGEQPVAKEAPPEKKEVEAPPPPSQSKPQLHEGVQLRIFDEMALKEQEEEKHEPPPPLLQRNDVRRKMPKIRQVIAKRLVSSLQESAMLTTFNEVDMSRIIELRTTYKEAFQKQFDVKLGFMSFFVTAAVEAIQALPDFNAYIEGDEIVQKSSIDIGIAVGTERGLVVPVVRNCEHLTFAEIERAIIGYAKLGREGRLHISDLEGGSFTITNGGIYGSMLSTPILNPPQVGILGMHNIIQRPVAINDQVEIRPMMYLALSYDHRLVDGKEAVTFLVKMKEVLEDPSRLFLFERGDEKS